MLRKLSKDVKLTLSILFILIGIILIFSNYFISIKKDLFNRKNIEYMTTLVELTEIPEEVIEEDITDPTKSVTTTTKPKLGKYDYIGYLSIPDINLERGFLSTLSKYNSVKYNIMLIKDSTMPDQKNGNLILAAHSGNSSISYFKHLYKLKMGAKATITYNNKDYTYQMVDKYEVKKDGTVEIKRNKNKTTLTLITCSKTKNNKQEVYIFELI